MEAGEGDGDRRRLSSSRRKSDSSNNLRSLLRVRDDENDGRTNVSRVTLSAVLSADKRRSPVRSRTLLDIIQDEPFGDRDDKNSWKQLKYMLGLRRAGAAWTSTIQIPTSEVPIQQNGDRMIGQSHSVQLQDAATPTAGTGTDESTQPEMPASSSSNTANNGVDSRPESNPSLNNRATIQRQNSSRISDSRLTTGNINVAESVGQNQEVHSTVTGGGIGGTAAASTGAVPDTPARMSLMALLAESDRQLGLEGSEFMMVDDDNQEDELVEASAGGGGGLAGGGADRNSCCVCMLRHKGAAFIPCGHTFCRLCSRELWVQRGNCPLCNGFILEILDIF